MTSGAAATGTSSAAITPHRRAPAVSSGAASYAPPAAASPAVMLTRRTLRLEELAGNIEAALADNGVVVDPTGIDENLRATVRNVGDPLAGGQRPHRAWSRARRRRQLSCQRDPSRGARSLS